MQLELIENDGINNKKIEYFDEKEKPDHLCRRSFFLLWDDFHAFAPGAKRNTDGSITRGQAYFANPEKYKRLGYVEKTSKMVTPY